MRRLKVKGMLSELRTLLANAPFVPFTIHMADGTQIHVPTRDHIAVSPKGIRVVVFDDKGIANVLSGLLMTRVSFDDHATPAGS